MIFSSKLWLAVCIAALAAPASLTAQQPDTSRARRDSTLRQDSIRTDSMRRAQMERTRVDPMRRDADGRTRDAAVQPRATSDQRLRVSKESDTEQRDYVADSIANADRMRQDALERAQRDSVAAVERARMDSVSRANERRADSVAAADARRRDSITTADAAAERERQLQNRYRFGNRGMYVGVAGGGSMPNGDLQRLGYGNGYTIDIPIGWHPRNSLLGWRVDLGYDQFSGANFSGAGPVGPMTLTNEDPRVLSAALNITLRAPLNASRSVGLYALGGGGLYHFRNFGRQSSLGALLGDDVLDANDTNFKNSRNKLGAQGGVGIDFGAGPASIYVESRFVNVFTNREDNTQFGMFFGGETGRNVRWVPIVLGVNFR